ncbi:MAG: hypothetical protein V2A34_07085, partial [Lentisphaerota bacterium]
IPSIRAIISSSSAFTSASSNSIFTYSYYVESSKIEKFKWMYRRRPFLAKPSVSATVASR